LLLLAGLLIPSCSEIEIAKFIEGSWELTGYYRNDVDETSEMLISNYMEVYNLDGTFFRSYTDGKQIPVEETGTFEIDDEGNTIHISDVSSISDFSEAHSSLSTSTITVEILDRSEYAYSFENGGDKHEFRFTLKE